jgi:hypothetical protein
MDIKEISDELEAKLAIAVEVLESIASSSSQSLILTVYPNMDYISRKATEVLNKIRMQNKSAETKGE